MLLDDPVDEDAVELIGERMFVLLAPTPKKFAWTLTLFESVMWSPLRRRDR
jgi:hypothetical protein